MKQVFLTNLTFQVSKYSPHFVYHNYYSNLCIICKKNKYVKIIILHVTQTKVT